MTWPMVKLEDLVSITSGFAFKSNLFSESEGVPLIRIRDVVRGVTETFYTGEYSKEFIINNGDILIGMDGDFNRARWKGGRALLNQRVCKIKADESNLCDNYLYHFLPKALDSINAKTHAVTVKHLSVKGIRDIKIPLPPLTEQKRIAAILDKADAIRQKRQQAISLADDFLRSIFLEMFIRAADNWTVKTIEYIADKGKGGLRTGPFGSHLLHSEFVDSGIPVLGIDNAVENSFKWGKARFITEGKYKSLSRYTVHPGDVLITIMGTCGRCAVVPDDIPTAINTKHLCCISPDYKKALPEFLHSYYLFHPMSRQYLAKVTKGAIMDGLNMGLIKTMPFPMVPIKLQEKYVEIKMAVLSNLDKQHLSESYQESLFNSLSQQLFAGKCLTA
ncbi:restriction endonuclease subunit S [Aeromonas jandaei]|uniref:restriction endonuclease subunit S n=1 Tax=Aeromonas jandaei TaxID=650 RepID=UPI003B9EEB34